MKALSTADFDDFKIKRASSNWLVRGLVRGSDLKFDLLESEDILSKTSENPILDKAMVPKTNFQLAAAKLFAEHRRLENMMSHLRHVIINYYGVSSIIIDGGGRIVFIGDERSENLINDSLTGMFSISNSNVPFSTMN